MLKNLSSPVRVTMALWLKPLFPQHEQRKLLVAPLEAGEAATLQAEQTQKSSQSEKQSWKEERWVKTYSSKFSIPEKSLIVPELTPEVFRLQEAVEGDWLMAHLWAWQGPRTTWDMVLPLHPQNIFLHGILKVKVSVSSGQFYSLKEIRDWLAEAFKHCTESTKWMKCFQKSDLLCSLYIIVGGENLALHGSLKQNFALYLVFQMMQGKHFLVLSYLDQNTKHIL